MFTVMEPEIQTPEVYRNTPFEHVSTAETGQLIVVFTIPISPVQGWVSQAGLVRVVTPIPGWMGVVAMPRPQVPVFEQPAEPLR